MEFLVFRLYGPMASWGEIAVGETRRTATHPSKSAITGLLGAALGIEREHDDIHQALSNDYLQGVSTLRTGRTMNDYHTAQAPDSVGKFQYRTRRDELVHGKDRLGTVLSTREYLSDAHVLVALRVAERAKYSLIELSDALKKPKFHLYLGRKAFPLAAPLAPQIMTADCFREAFNRYKCQHLIKSDYEWVNDDRWLAKDKMQAFYWEGEINDFSQQSDEFNQTQVQKIFRYDKPLSRCRWQFEPRTEYFWQYEREIS